MKNYLIGGGIVSKGETRRIDKIAVANSKHKKVTILLLSKRKKKKIELYKKFSPGYFKKLGAKHVDIIFPDSSRQEIIEKTKNPDMVFLTGGDTDYLLKNIKKLRLLPFIKRANVVLGNSAGALAQVSSGFGLKKFFKGLKLLKITIIVHYKPEQDKMLLKFSKKRDIYAIPEKSALVYDKKLKTIGRVWKFSKGKKISL